MNWERLNRRLIVIARCGVGGLLVYAGAGKLLEHSATPTMFSAFFPAGSTGASVAATSEILLGCWLITGVLRRCAAGIALVTLLIFSGLIIREMDKPNPNPCGCIREVLPDDGGSGEVIIDRSEQIRHQLRMSLGRNLALIGCAGMTLLHGRTTAGVRNESESSDRVVWKN